MRYEVTHYRPGNDTPTVTDAAGVTELVREAASTGRRLHIRPITEPDAAPTTTS